MSQTVILEQPTGSFVRVIKDEQDILDLLPFLRAFIDKASLSNRIVNISLVDKDDFLETLRENQTP